MSKGTKRPSITKQGKRILTTAYNNGRGTSKHADLITKGKDGISDKIYSDNTYQQYMNRWEKYCQWMTEAGHHPHNLDEAKRYMPEYVEHLKNSDGCKGGKMSAWSVRNYFAGPAKVLGLKANDYDLPSRERQDIFRSREAAVRDRNFSEKRNSEFVEFCRATGLRNRQELSVLHGDALVLKGDKAFIHVYDGKGGKERLAPVYGSQEQVKAVVGRMQAAGSGRVWAHIPSNADVHSYRADYAARVYHANERPIETLSMKEKYFCKRDMAGTVLDRHALKTTSEALGHSRLNVVAVNYAYKF